MLDQKIVEVAMNIITEAGDARFLVDEALTCIENGDFAKVDEKISGARKLLAKAHGMQTDIIQSEGDGELCQHPLLFIHAQDTLMTVNSEMNMVKRLHKIFISIDARLEKLEKGA
jgi:PTS system cellobiose-specific IIA component